MLDIEWGGIGCLALFVAITALAPRILATPRFIARHPRLAIAVWLDTLAMALLALGVGAGLLVADGLAEYVTPATDVNWVNSVVQSLLAWAAVALLGVIVFRLVAAASTIRAENEAGIRVLSRLLRSSVAGEIGGHPVRIVDDASVVVAAIPRTKDIIVSTGFINTVPERLQLAALSHECSHLTNRHHTLVTAAHLAMATAAGIPASRRFAQAMRISTELAADDDAARIHGETTVAEALTACFGGNANVAERTQRLMSRSR